MFTAENLKEIKRKNVTVEELFNDLKDMLDLKLLNGRVGLNNLIDDIALHRPGLALSGYLELFTFSRIQIFGNMEIRYLNHFDYSERLEVMKKYFDFPIPCICLTNNNILDEGILNLAAERGIPVLKTTKHTVNLMYKLRLYLYDKFSPHVTIHGTFLDVYGVGIIFVGRSGIGKSEIALDLIERGHRLVADDVISVARKGQEMILIGNSNHIVKHFMEIRGLGLIDVRSIFGVRAIRYSKRVEILVELEDWSEGASYTRTGLDDTKISILGVEILYLKLPIFPGKNITVISEVIALNYILKHYGYDTAKEFQEQLRKTISEKKSGTYITPDVFHNTLDVE